MSEEDRDSDFCSTRWSPGPFWG